MKSCQILNPRRDPALLKIHMPADGAPAGLNGTDQIVRIEPNARCGGKVGCFVGRDFFWKCCERLFRILLFIPSSALQLQRLDPGGEGRWWNSEERSSTVGTGKPPMSRFERSK